MGAFFGELYLRTTRPFLDPRVTALEAEFVTTALQLSPHERALDLCCGHGRHLRELRARGYDVVGLERDPLSMAAISPLDRGAVVQGDLYHLPFSGPFDALYCWYASLYLSADDAVNRAALRQAAYALRPGGRMLIHGHNPEAQLRAGDSHFETRLADGSTLQEDTWFVPSEGVLHGRRRWEAQGRVLEGSFQVRCPTPADHRAWAQELGLVLESAWGDIHAAMPTVDSPDLIALIRRPEA